ncbi:MAG: TRAP transporter small permease subunit [Bacteroidota bacterium]
MEKYITKFLQYGTLLSTLALIGSVALQIFARFFLANTPPWTEEASRLFFIYATSFAAGLAFKEQYYVHLDLFFDKMSAGVQKLVLVLIPLLILILFGLMAAYTIPFIIRGQAELAPSMNLQMSLAFGSMFILAASIAYYACLMLIEKLKSPQS